MFQDKFGQTEASQVDFDMRFIEKTLLARTCIILYNHLLLRAELGAMGMRIIKVYTKTFSYQAIPSSPFSDFGISAACS